MFWGVAELLYIIYEKNLYHGWGFQTFREYVERDLRISARRAQYLVSMWRWSLELPRAARRWARSERWSVMKAVYQYVDGSNWKAWRACLRGASFRQVELLVLSMRSEEAYPTRERIMELARAQAALRHDGRSDRVAVLRSAGMRAVETADDEGMTEREVRERVRLVQAFVSTQVYEWMRAQARSRHEELGVWLSRWLARQEAQEHRRRRVRVVA
jgi:hypothetical protein